MKDETNSTYASGCVLCGVCPAPVYVTTSTCGSASATRATTAARCGGLWTPRVSRTGLEDH